MDRRDKARAQRGTAEQKHSSTQGSSNRAAEQKSKRGPAAAEQSSRESNRTKQHRKQGGKRGEDHTLRGRFFRYVRPCGPDVALVLGTCGSSNV